MSVMGRKIFIRWVGCLASTSIFLGTAQADDQVRISYKTNSEQAIDLVYNGRPIDKDQAAELQIKGIDISQLDPMPNDIWTPKELPYTNAEKFNYPPEGASFDYSSKMNASGFFRGQVLHNNRPFRLVVDMDHHQAQATAALMRRLGYPVDSPKNYRKVTIQFQSKEEMDGFYYDMGLNTRFARDRWITREDLSALRVDLQDVTIEYPRIEIPTYYWGRASASWLDGRRAARAMIIPLSLLDIRLSSNSINIFSWEFGRIMSQNVLLNHPYAGAFNGETTFEDARWIARKIGQLTRDEFKAIVAESHFPHDIQAIVLEKLIARRNHMVTLFKLDKDPLIVTKIPFKTNVNIGSVRHGEVNQEYYEGYAPRFTVGDPKSPLRWSEIKHYLKMEGIAQAINVATSAINKKIQLFTAEEGQQKFAQNFAREVTDYCTQQLATNPFEPCRYVVPLKAWAQPLAGLNVSASRSLVTGTYYGSDAKAQLVDNISIGASVGIFGGTTAIQGPWKNVGVTASAGYQRNYTHVRPVAGLAASKNESWKNLYVPGFMKHLGKTIDLAEEDSKLQKSDVNDSLVKFLSELKDGEVFTITDSYVGQLGPQANIPLTGLMGAALGELGPTVGVGVTGDWVIMKRVMITRRDNRLEIYDSKINMRALSGNMSLNMWIQLAKVQMQGKRGNATTDATMIDLTPVTDGDLLKDPNQDAIRKKMAITLREVFVHNDIEVAQYYFPPVNLTHELQGKLKNAKALMWTWSGYDENHKVKITLADDPDHPFDRDINARSLYSTRRVRLQGKNPYGLLGQVVSKVSGVSGLLDPGNNLNPSNTFLGKANWSTVKTEAEITEGRDFKPMMILEDFYSGWSISRDQFLKIMNTITDEVKSLNGGNPLFRAEVFNSTDKVQAYEIRSSTFIYPAGLENIRTYLQEGTNCIKGKPCRELLVRLIDLTAFDDLRKRCKNYILSEVVSSDLEELEKIPETDKTVWKKCVTPWMRKVIRQVRKAPPRSDKETFVQWTNSMMDLLLKNGDFARLLNRVGEDNYYFSVSVSGFRTKDENGDQKYFTDSIGSIGRPVTLGPFADLEVVDTNQVKWKISDFETQARYFGNGL
jgi:hypothetical protein